MQIYKKWDGNRMEYYKKWSEERWIFLSWCRSWTLKEWRESHDSIASWIFGFIFDGFNEQGDPSGFHFILLGSQLEIYWPMYRPIEFRWALGEKPRWSFRWKLSEFEKSLLP